MNRVRKSLRSNTNRDGGNYESKPSVNTSTVSSLTCSVMGNTHHHHHHPTTTTTDEMNMDIDVVKRIISHDVTVETEADSVDMNSVSGSSNDHTRRGSSIQDEIVNNQQHTEKTPELVINNSVSSLTLESDIRFYHKAKSKSFNDVRRVPTVNPGSKSMSRHQSVLYGLEGIREEFTRPSTVVTSVSSTSGLMEDPSLTLTDLQSTCFQSTYLPKGGGGIDSFMEDTSVDSFMEDDITDSQAVSEGQGSSRELCNSHDDISPDQKNSSSKPHKKNFLRRILSRGERSVESYESSETLELISLLHESNLENESTIKRLEQELSQMTTERDAFRTNSDRVVKVMSAKQIEMEDQLQVERKVFAKMSSVHKEEIKGWMDKARLLSTKILDLEKQAKTRDVDDEVRAQKIINLERSMAYLLSNIDISTSHKVIDDAQVENILGSFESTKHNSDAEPWEKKYHEMVSENKRVQSDAKQCQATVKKLEDENRKLRNDIADCNDKLLIKIRQLSDESTALAERCSAFDLLKAENIKMNDSLIQAAAEKSVNVALEEALKRSSAVDEKVQGCLDENEAMEQLKVAVDKLKADQQHDRETIVSLRMENLKLKEGIGNTKPISRPPPPPPPPSIRKSEEKATFEARLEKLEKANKDLKDANAALATKLTAEAEKTKALLGENEGLETKICKLVAFIKQQANCV
eukprot:scaffold642_cov75-Cyclotella_meneghiniana.AAC.9